MGGILLSYRSISIFVFITILIFSSIALAEEESYTVHTVKQTPPGAPKNAVRIRTNQPFLDKTKDLMVAIVDKMVTKFQLEPLVSEQGEIRNMKITEFRKPQTSSLVYDPTINGVRGEFRNMFIRLNGNIWAPKYHINVDFSAPMSDVKVVLGISFSRSTKDATHFVLVTCDTHIGKVDSTVTNAGSMAKLIKEKLDLALPQSMDYSIWRQMKIFIEGQLNKQFKEQASFNVLGEEDGPMRPPPPPPKLPPRPPGAPPLPPPPKLSNNAARGSLASTLKRTLDTVRKLRISSVLAKYPIVTSNSAEFNARGEFSFEDRGGTPYNYPWLNETDKTPNHMVMLAFTDYVMNSFLYHANEHELFHVKFGADYVQDKDFAQVVQLLFDVLLGTIMPDFEDQYPNHIVALEYNLRRSPMLLFEKNGNISGENAGLLKLSARKNQTGTHAEDILVLNLDCIAQFKFVLVKQLIRGNFSFSSFKITRVESKIKNFDDEKLHDLEKFLKSTVSNLIATTLGVGLRIPEFKGMHFTNSTLQVYDRVVKLQTNLEYDEKEIIKQSVDKMLTMQSGTTPKPVQPIKKDG